MENFPKGSEWRKWDLHVHTPASVLNNGFGQNWDEYVKNLFTTLLQKEISAVGITDYFTIAGYKKLREEYLDSPEKMASLFGEDEIIRIKKILVMPNIEFRSNIFVGSNNSVNFHVLLSDELSPTDIEERFLHEIHFIYQGDPQQADKRRVLRELNLIELGERLKKEQGTFTESALRVGMMNAVVDHVQVSGLLAEKQSIFGGKYLFVVMADEDLSRIDWRGRDHLTRKILVQKSDMLFTSNPRTVQWALGKSPYGEGPKGFIEEFKSLKPCIHGSDAHEHAFIGHPCAKRGDKSHACLESPDKCELRFCWIKADPTFEGLKQLLFEPEDRVWIRQETPLPLKSSQSISEFTIGSSVLDSELSFGRVSVSLNDGLVAVTGGKGGGKTAFVDLLANMYVDRASCRDKNSFVRRIAESKTATPLTTSLRVHDGLEHEKEIKDGTVIDGVSVIYLAQGELEEHVEDPARLEAHINHLIFESDEIRDSQLRFDYEGIDDDLSDACEKLISTNDSIYRYEIETSAEKEAEASKEGKMLDVELKDAKKKAGELSKILSPEMILEAQNKQKQITKLRERKERLTSFGLQIKEALKFVDESIPAFNELVGRLNDISDALEYTEKFGAFNYKDEASLRALIERVRVDVRKVIGEMELYQKDLEAKDKGVKDHAKLLDRIKELEKGIKLGAQKLEIMAKKKKTCEESRQARSVMFRELLAKRKEQRDKYLAIISAFCAEKNIILSDLQFTAELLFEKDRFLAAMSEVIDSRKVRIIGRAGSESDVEFFTAAMDDFAADPTDEKIEAIVQENMPALLAKVMDGRRRAETQTAQTIYDAVFNDYLTVSPSVKYKKVKLSKLSLGQKATVLIKIYLAQGDCPIIIDSHDDHLDNEFIMDELVNALRQAKEHRQVIVVSNNGNVVVNSDAEQVIIASRDENGKIGYEAGSLENPKLRSKLLSVLEGGEVAFGARQNKYRLRNS